VLLSYVQKSKFNVSGSWFQVSGSWFQCSKVQELSFVVFVSPPAPSNGRYPPLEGAGGGFSTTFFDDFYFFPPLMAQI
jgi:hypothetical protein